MLKCKRGCKEWHTKIKREMQASKVFLLDYVSLALR